ncbi:DNA-directed RNA polymerase subunit alpha C-terminal domain-containing protein [Kribbella pratensis]|uniref:Sigma-70-like protein n=1 Tax=Kribbella pratensis TaxID=2512112 RepID=A0A4R8BSI3_9ACTN|nr:DNA-directed RNA polymerase subunit alpha C-terminal domain-containing protein [Kribbella pratensis]TDW60768.1 sigma-70-like protein [Kribbella pratensis]
MHDVDFVDTHPRVWSDAFPWLRGSLSGDDELRSWRDMAMDDAAGMDRRRVLSSVVSLAINHLEKWPIGEVFPGMPLEMPIDDLDLTVRAYNVLHRERKLTTSDLADVRIEDLLACRNAGIGTVRDILRNLADRSTSLPQASLADDTTMFVEPASSAALLGGLINDIEALAEWNLLLGQEDRGLLAPLALGAPMEIAAARERILALSATAVAPPSSADVAEVLEQAILGMDERFRVILARRLFAWKPMRLEQLGQEFGVTRERVRQLESKARSKLYEVVAEGTPAGQVAAVVRSEVRGVRPLQELLTEIPALARTVESVGQPAWRVIDILDDSYEIADGWCAEPSLDAAKRETAIYLDELADEFGVVRLADVGLVGSGEPGTLPWLTEWLQHLGCDVRDGFVLLRTSSVGDVAAAALSIEGGPLTLEVLFERANRGSIGSLRNQLNTDPRFHKVDVEHWALTAWGMDGYSNIRTEIAKLLEQAGGELPLATIVESLVERFGVSPASVNVYAGSAPYEVRNGIVRSEAIRTAGGKNPAKVQGYYRRGQDWLHRTTVTRDHLRGSGWGASTAIATIVGLSPGETAELPTRLGPQKFSWKNHQPAYGSIKRFLEADDLGIGDEVFLVFRGDGTFDVEKLAEPTEEPRRQALRLVGADMNLAGQEAVDALAAAIKYPAGDDVETVAAGYAARREQPIAELLGQCQSDFGAS